MKEPPFFELNPLSPWGRTVTDEELSRIFRTGRLNGEALARFWRMNEFNQPMPEYLDVMVNKKDFQNLVRELVKEGVLPKRKLKELKKL